MDGDLVLENAGLQFPYLNTDYDFDGDIPFTTISPFAVAAGTIKPPGHIQNEYTPLLFTCCTKL